MERLITCFDSFLRRRFCLFPSRFRLHSTVFREDSLTFRLSLALESDDCSSPGYRRQNNCDPGGVARAAREPGCSPSCKRPSFGFSLQTLRLAFEALPLCCFRRLN